MIHVSGLGLSTPEMPVIDMPPMPSGAPSEEGCTAEIAAASYSGRQRCWRFVIPQRQSAETDEEYATAVALYAQGLYRDGTSRDPEAFKQERRRGVATGIVLFSAIGVGAAYGVTRARGTQMTPGKGLFGAAVSYGALLGYGWLMGRATQQ